MLSYLECFGQPFCEIEKLIMRPHWDDSHTFESSCQRFGLSRDLVGSVRPRGTEVANIAPLFYLLGTIGTVQFGLLMWVHMKHLGFAGLNPVMLVPLLCRWEGCEEEVKKIWRCGLWFHRWLMWFMPSNYASSRWSEEQSRAGSFQIVGPLGFQKQFPVTCDSCFVLLALCLQVELQLMWCQSLMKLVGAKEELSS